MKTTLIAVHQLTKDEPIPMYGSLGVLALAASLKSRNFECEVIDLVRYNKIGDRPFEEIALEITDKIIRTRPNIIGFSTISDSLIKALEIAKRLKKSSPEVCIVFGGPGVSYCAAEVITQFPEVDYIIRGEADFAFPDFISEYQINNKNPEIKGLVYQKNNEIVDLGWPDPVANLDDLPIPAYEFCEDLNSKGKWFDQNFGFFIEAGRGCPYNCNFCSTSHFFKRKFRVKSVERLIEEIKYIEVKSKNKRIILNHDLLTFKQDFMEKLCDGLKHHFPNLNWGCNARLDTIDHRLLQKMANSGCSYVYIGIEAATDKLQKSIGKRLDLTRVDSILQSLRDLKYDFVFSFVIGLPEEEVSDVEALFSMALKAKLVCQDKCLIQIHPLIPELGSRILQENPMDLIYDEESSVIDTAIPRHWKEQRKIIAEHPKIFARFFSLKNTLLKYPPAASEPSKYSFFSYLLEKLMKKSLIYAYRIIGDQFSPLIIGCFDNSKLAISNSLYDTDFSDLLEKIQVRTYQVLNNIGDKGETYNSIAKYEIAVFQVLFHRSADFICNIEVAYQENDILEFVANPDREIFSSDKKHNLIFFWDVDRQKVKCLEISPDFAMLIRAESAVE